MRTNRLRASMSITGRVSIRPGKEKYPFRTEGRDSPRGGHNAATSAVSNRSTHRKILMSPHLKNRVFTFSSFSPTAHKSSTETSALLARRAHGYHSPGSGMIIKNYKRYILIKMLIFLSFLL